MNTDTRKRLPKLLFIFILIFSLSITNVFAEGLETEAYYDTSVHFPNGWNEEDSFSGSIQATIQDDNVVISSQLSVTVSGGPNSDETSYTESDLLEQGSLITSSYWASFVSIGCNGGQLGWDSDQVVNGKLVIPVSEMDNFTTEDNKTVEIYFFHRVPHKNSSYDVVASQRVWGSTSVDLAQKSESQDSQTSDEDQTQSEDHSPEEDDEEEEHVDNPNYVNLMSWTKGMVQIQRAGSDQLIRARHRMPIGPGDKIYTARNSSCELIGPKTIITMKEQSSFTVQNERLKAEKNSRFRVIFKDVKETFNNFFTPEDYEVETPTNVIGIRGTDFIVNIGSNGETEILLREGEVSVLNKYDDKQTILYSGEKIVTIPNQSTSSSQQLANSEVNEFNEYISFDPVPIKLDETIYSGEVGDGISYVIQPEENGEYNFYHEAEQRVEESDNTGGNIGSDIADRVVMNIYTSDDELLKSSYSDSTLYRDQAAYDSMMRSDDAIDYKQLANSINVELKEDNTYYLYIEPAFNRDIGRQYMFNASFVKPLASTEESSGLFKYIIGIIILLIIFNIFRRRKNKKQNIVQNDTNTQTQSFCKTCGSPVKENQVFCPNCGQKLENK